MQHLEDQAGQIKAFLNGDGDPLYGPIGAYPQSQFLPANGKTNLYPFSVSSAISVLKANGWTVTPNGTDVCKSAGTGATQCGAGIPAGTKLTFPLVNHMIANDNDPASPKTIDKWAVEDFGGFTDSTYPTTLGVFNSTGSSNLGGYASPEADKLIQASVTSSNPAAVTAEASYLTQQQVGLFQPNPDLVQVWKKTLSGPPASFETLTQYNLNPEYWYFTK